jgi:hypothetical protein
VNTRQRRALINAAVAAGATMLLGLALVSLLFDGEEAALPRATPSSPAVTCAPTWEAIPSPDPQDGGSLLLGVSAVAADDAWAVGGSGDPVDPTRTLAIRWSGAEWDVVPTPNAGTVGNRFNAVDALSPDAAFAVGHSSDGVGDTPLAAAWQAGAWELLPMPDDLGEGALTGVTAIATDDVWAVGWTGDPALETERALGLHWDGSGWTRAPVIPAIGGGRSSLTAVSALASNDVWAVGYHHNGPTVVHFDGIAWSRSTMDAEGDFLAIAAVAPGDAWVAGSDVARFDGQAWTPAGAVRGEGTVGGIDAVSPTDVWAVGVRPAGEQGEPKALVQRWDGARWALVAGTGVPGSETLTAVSALSDGTVLAVGYRDARGGRSTLVVRGATCFPGA